jgi:two-component system, LuxR family, sensor kinase FixL
MSLITIIWSAAAGACLMLAVVHLLVWCRNTQTWSNLCFPVMALGVVGLLLCEMLLMKSNDPATYGQVVRGSHLAYMIFVVGSLGFLHFFFGTGRSWLLFLALGLRLMAVIANFTTGSSLHFTVIHALEQVSFLGETVSIVSSWEQNPWVRVGQLASLVQIAYVMDASLRLWRRGAPDDRRRAVLIGGSLVLFILMAAGHSGLAAAGISRVPLIVSFPFFVTVLAISLELTRDVHRAALLARDLEKSERRLTLAASAARLALWEWDIRKNQIWIPKEGRELYGVSADESITFEGFINVIHPEDKPLVKRAVENAFATLAPYQVEYRIELPDGELRWIGATGRVDCDELGRPALLRGVSLDISGRKNAERDAVEQRLELAHLSRVSVLGELAGALAHELNQPLAAMLGNAQVGCRMLATDRPDLAELTAIFDDIVADAKRAGGIIHGLRAMVKKEDTPGQQPLPLNEIVVQVLTLLRGEFIARKMICDFQPADNLPLVTCGRVEIQQVIMNLLVNAMDAMGTPISGVTPTLVLQTSLQGNKVVLSVRDHGPGIPADFMPRLFEPFASTKPGGLGLGLSICQTIAKRHHGEIVAENHPDGGAVFRLLLHATPPVIHPFDR